MTLQVATGGATAKQVVDLSALPTDEERQLLRDSARGYLKQHWPTDKALALAEDPKHVSAIWQGLAEQGFAALGSDPAEGSLREALVVMEELGRASCPAPMIGAFLTNIALRDRPAESSEFASLLSSLHQGKASVAFAFGIYDGDPNAGCVKLSNGTLTGAEPFVEGAQTASYFFILVDGPALALVKKGAAGVTVTPTPGLSVPPLAQVNFSKTPCSILMLTLSMVEDLNRLARLALVGRSLGAANRAFEMVVEYSKERHQFGQQIAKFQAIQHKLANCLTSLEGVRQSLWAAATSFDFGSSDWRVFASAAYAFAGPALRQVSLETHHTFGAIGYSEEHEAPRHFRRTHGDLTRYGGVRHAREELAHYLIDEGHTLPEYDLGPAANAFRQEVNDWLTTYWSGERKACHESLPFELRKWDPEFTKAVANMGWIGISWPIEYGGQARSPLQQLAFHEAMTFVHAPARAHFCAAYMQAPAIMKFGTPEQKAKFLPAILRGELSFCLGYSEPGSGSDLASLRTSAVRDGDEWVINGQKLWCTDGEKAQYVWLAVRTDPNAKPQHAGISMFAVPLNSPGITIHPSMALYGHSFCTVFFDDVRVPASALIGEVNGGWKVITSALADERMLMGASVVEIRRAFQALVENVRVANDRDNSAVRDRIGALASELEVARRFMMHAVSMAEQNRVAMAEAAISKHFTGELMERVGEASLDILGLGATLSEGSLGALSDGLLEQVLRFSMMLVIAGGTAEIQRTLIALRGLNLPR